MTTTGDPPPGVGQRITLTLFFLVFLGMGLAFVGLVVRSVWTNAVTYRWTAVPCVVLESRVLPPGPANSAARLDVRYRYDYDGREYISTRYSQGIAGGGDSGETYRLSQLLAPGSAATAYVNPAQPDQAVLHRENLWSALIVLFPLVFVAVGAGGLTWTWRSRRPAAGPQRPLSSAAGNRRSRLAAGLFFGIFFFAGLGFGLPFFVLPLWHMAEARNWPRVPGRILSSEVQSHSGRKGPTYSVEVAYRYTVAGRSYTAGRYQFMSGSSSGYERKAAIVARLRPGTAVFCYVNPADPTDAVIERGFTPELWIGLVPLVFMAIGAGGMVAMARQPRAATAGIPAATAISPGAAADLKPGQSRVGRFAGLLLVALFWNGIVAVFVVQSVLHWRGGGFDWFQAVFLLPFVAIGLVLLGVVAGQFLALFNPRVRVTSPDAVPLGGAVEVAWTVKGRVERLRRLRISLEGREEATYRSGKDTHTERSVFSTTGLFDTGESAAMRAGSVRLAVPAGTMHSFRSAHNRIVWTLRVRGEIAHWPDIDDEFPLTVLPQPLKR
jgi:hypothetical protein